MRRVVPSLCVCWLAWCATGASNPLNTAPLAFGMTPQEAATALGMPLTHLSGRRGSEIYYALGPEGIPGFYPTDTALALQFRRGRLTGWKRDWNLRRSWPF
jgi:hypothetical protein